MPASVHTPESALPYHFNLFIIRQVPTSWVRKLWYVVLHGFVQCQYIFLLIFSIKNFLYKALQVRVR